MSNHSGQERIELLRGDLTKIHADAIVNAANTSLAGGGGVDGAIHRAAGPELLKETLTLGGCPTGQARLTKGYHLPAAFVIHTPGPIWIDGNHQERELLAACYYHSLEIASAEKFHTIAFPNISTGVYGFPKEEAAIIALKTVSDYLKNKVLPKKVLFVMFEAENFEIYQRLIGQAENH